MGLDVYVGSLARYYSGEWKTIIQQAAEQKGEQVEVVYHGRPADAPPGSAPVRPSRQEATEAVEAWRQFLNEHLEAQLGTTLTWDESETAPYFTDKPAWDSYFALLLWAAYNDNPRLSRPTELPDEPADDPALVASKDRGPSSRYSHLLLDVELWLPVPFADPFPMLDPGSTQLVVGSSIRLVQHLEDLNDLTWRAQPEVIEGWEAECPDAGASLDDLARFGFALMLSLARKAVEHRLPMRLDY